MKSGLAIDGSVSVSHGSAVWSLQVLESMDSFRVIESRVGVLAGERIRFGVDVDSFVRDIWKACGTNGYMELRLMLCSGLVVEIDSIKKHGLRSQVLAVKFDQSFYPSGLKGRWVECSITGQKQPSPRKSRCSVATA